MVFIAFDHKPIVDNCTGCNRVVDQYCVAYVNPEAKWCNGRCPLCSIPVEKGAGEPRKKLNPLKASRGRGGVRPMMPHKRGKYEKGDADRH